MAGNYWKLKNPSLFTVSYAYLDVDPFLSTALFQRKQIRMRYKYAIGFDSSAYRVVVCKVPKRKIEKFEEVMEELKNKMLLLGYSDYGNVCSKIEGLLLKKAEQRAAK